VRPPPTSWNRSRSAGSPFSPPPPPASGKTPAQHHRHPWPRRLHHRGLPLAEGAGRRRRRFLRFRRCGAPVGNQLALRQRFQGRPHYLRQQAGPHRGRFLPRRRSRSKTCWQPSPWSWCCPSGLKATSSASSTCSPAKPGSGMTPACRRTTRSGCPEDMKEQGRRVPRSHHRDWRSNRTTTCWRSISKAKSRTDEDHQEVHPQGHPRPGLLPHLLRLFL
jgi:hypothetical protein